MLEFQHVTFQYDSEDFNIIDDLSFTVEPEEFISIIGISGCGKSTIFKLTNGLLKRKSGNILLNGQDIASVNMLPLYAEGSLFHGAPLRRIYAFHEIASSSVRTNSVFLIF
ncbi:MAG: ATP-binding cassette domain-containing protein [Coprococcus sp.]